MGRSSIGLRDDGTLAGFGNNAAGQLAMPGLAETYYLKFRLSPVGSEPSPPAMIIRCCFAKITGLCPGVNDQLQLGSNVGDSTAYPVMVPGLNNITAISAGKQHALAIDSSGQLCLGREQ